MPVVIYIASVFFWQWLLGHFIELDILHAKGISGVLIALGGLFVADFLAASVFLDKDDRALVCLLLIIFFGYSVYSDTQQHLSILEATIVEYETLLMMIAAICAARE